MKPIPSWLGRLPGVHRYYRQLLPLFPLAARWPIPACDVLLSFSHCVAKAARPPAGVPHICYCFTPMRYAWQLRDAYLPGVRGRLAQPVLDLLRWWDKTNSAHVTHFIAISRTIQQRIHECYARHSTVIYPPVDTRFYTPARVPREDFYLICSALVPYKRFDLAIQACNKLNARLVVIGQGPEEARLRALAGPNVQFLGWQEDFIVRDYYRRARALLFPAEEDFGIVPLEAQACGCPVIALGRGGCLETVRPLGQPKPTGVFFQQQTADQLVEAIRQFERERSAFDPTLIRQNALPFSAERFAQELSQFVQNTLEQTTRRRAAA